MPPIAVQHIKAAIIRGQDASLEAGLALERALFQGLFATADQSEGMHAFIEKRRPDFKGVWRSCRICGRRLREVRVVILRSPRHPKQVFETRSLDHVLSDGISQLTIGFELRRIEELVRC